MAQLSLLTTGRKVIPLVCEYPSLVITDIKLPDLVVSNHLTAPVTPVEIQVIGTESGKKIAAFLVGRDRLVSLISQVNPQFKKILAAATSDTRNRLAVGLGEISVDAVALSDNATIGPRQCAIILSRQQTRSRHQTSCISSCRRSVKRLAAEKRSNHRVESDG